MSVPLASFPGNPSANLFSILPVTSPPTLPGAKAAAISCLLSTAVSGMLLWDLVVDMQAPLFMKQLMSLSLAFLVLKLGQWGMAQEALWS